MNNIPSLFFSFYIDEQVVYMIEDRTPQKILLKDFLNRHFSINLQTSGEKKNKRLRNLLESGKTVLVRHYDEPQTIDCFSYVPLRLEGIEIYFKEVDGLFEQFKDDSVFEDIVLETIFSIDEGELKEYLLFQLQQFTHALLSNYEFQKFPYLKPSQNLIQKRMLFFKYLKQFYSTFNETLAFLENQERNLFKTELVESKLVIDVFKQEIDLFKDILKEVE